MNPGPPLQNHLWSILVRSRFYPVLLTGDLQKAFLQVSIKEQELRFHWRAPGSVETATYRFTRALFGLTCSPFLLGGVLNEHLNSWEKEYPDLVKEIRDGLYVDNMMTGGKNVEEVAEKKVKAIKVFEDATFKLHKWHSNASELEDEETISHEPPSDVEDTTFAKQQLGSHQPNEATWTSGTRRKTRSAS